MPTYRYECHSGHVAERVCSIAEMEAFEQAGIPPCPCGHPMLRSYAMQKPIAFHAGWYEHVGPEPVYISNMQQLHDTCEKNGLYSRYAENHGGLFKRSRNRWI